MTKDDVVIQKVHDKQEGDGDGGPDDGDAVNDANNEDTCEEVYLFDSQSIDRENNPDDEEEENASLDETSIPQRVSHKHNLFKVLDEDLLKQMTASMIKLNYIWTQIGTEMEDAEHMIAFMKAGLIETVQQFVDQEDSKHRSYCKQVRCLKSRVESLLEDLAVFAPEEILQQWLRSPNSEQIGDVQMGSCLRAQILFLQKRYHSLARHRDQHLRQFESLKKELNSLLQKLGLPYPNDLKCEEIMAKRVASYSEMTLLKGNIDEYRGELERRSEHCRHMSNEIRSMAMLVPLEVNPDNLVPSNEENFIFSEKVQTQLDQLYASALEATHDGWHQLLDMSDQVDKLYRLFEVEADLRHPYFNTISQIASALDQSSSPWLVFHHDQKGVTLLKAMEELKNERDDYLALKSERMAELIGSIRRQFTALLAECLVELESLQNDARFRFLFVADFNEEALNKHENELERLRQYHHKFRPIFSLVTQWREQKHNLLECDQLLQNGSNYRNRGGILQQLLTKQRLLKKRIQQNIKQIGAWLHEQSSKPSEEHSSLPFDLYNIRLEDIYAEVGPDLAQQQKTARLTKGAARSSILSTPLSLMTPANKRTVTFTKQKLFSNSSLLATKSTTGSRVKEVASGRVSSTRKMPPSAYINRFR